MEIAMTKKITRKWHHPRPSGLKSIQTSLHTKTHRYKYMKVAIMTITSIDVVLLDTSDECMTMKQRRLKAKAKLITAL